MFDVTFFDILMIVIDTNFSFAFLIGGNFTNVAKISNLNRHLFFQADTSAIRSWIVNVLFLYKIGIDKA